MFIPHDLGISAITFWLENKRNIVQDRFSKEFILETVKIIYNKTIVKKTLPALSYIRCKFLSVAIQKLFVML
jgi:hypothetical protein